MKPQALEISLSLMAAVGGTIAAVVGTTSAYRDAQRDELERSPAIHIACRPEFRAAEIAQRIKAPEETLLLTEAGAQWVHVGGAIGPPKPGQAAAPEPFARCEVKNYGRLPIMDIRIPLHLTFGQTGSSAKKADTAVDIPGLSADTAYEFSLLNGTAQNMSFQFDRAVELTRVDRGAPVKITMYADRRLAELEAHAAKPTLVVQATAPPADEYAPPAATVAIDNFHFKPASMQISRGASVTFENRDDEAHSLLSADKSIASGAISPRAKWTHTFERAGTFALHCDYHTYMLTTIRVL